MELDTQRRVRRSHLYWHLVFFGVALGLVYLVLRGLEDVLAPIAGALLLSYLFDPVVTWLERRLRLARWLGTLLLFLAVLLVGAVLTVLVVPVLVRELTVFADAVPGYMIKIRDAVVPWVERTFRTSVPSSWHELADTLGSGMKEVATRALGRLGGVAGTVATGTASLLSGMATLLLVPIFLFYFLPAFPRIVRGAEGFIPRRHLAVVRETAADVNRALAAWIRGQLSVMAALAVFYCIALSIVGIKMAVIIGLLTGALAFIPYVGVIVGFTLALLVSLLEYHGLGQLVGIGAIFGVAQILDGLVLTPYLVGEKVGLGPVGVLIALMLGGRLFGFMGVLIAVPTAAALVVLLRRVKVAYQTSAFYQRVVPPAAAAAVTPTPTDPSAAPPVDAGTETAGG